MLLSSSQNIYIPKLRPRLFIAGGISAAKHLGLLGSAKPTRKMYTDVIERGDSDDSYAFHFAAKPPLNKER